MRSSLRDDIEGAEQSIIDWYDGVVSSIASLDQQHVFVSLLAWDRDVDKKVYAVVPIDGAISDSMKLLLSDDPGTSKQARWDAIQGQIAQLRTDCGGTLSWSNADNLGNVLPRRKKSKSMVISDHSLENVDKWFRLVEGDI